jgi:hypothetical protein
VNLKIGVQRVGLNLCKSGLGAAYWARVSWREHERHILKTHVLSFRPTRVRCDLKTLGKSTPVIILNGKSGHRPRAPRGLGGERALGSLA